MFLLKKIFSRIFFPLPVCCELLIVGSILLWFSKRQKAGKYLVSAGVLLLLLLSNGLVGDLLLSPLESKYPPLTDPSSLSKDPEAPVRWVVVLGGGRTIHPRFMEAARAQNALPGSKLLISVADEDGRDADSVRQMARLIGLRREELLFIEGARDTREEMERIRQTVGEARFVLVTSASHMPRAMELFQGAGMNPLPAPTEHLVKTRSIYEIWIPSADSLYESERAIYEYLGLLWLRVAG